MCQSASHPINPIQSNPSVVHLTHLPKETWLAFFPHEMCQEQDTCCCPTPGPSRTLQQGAPYLGRQCGTQTIPPQRSVPAPHPAIPGKPRSREHISWSVHKMVGCDLTTRKRKTPNQCTVPLVAWKKRFKKPSRRETWVIFWTTIAATGCRVYQLKDRHDDSVTQ